MTQIQLETWKGGRMEGWKDGRVVREDHWNFDQGLEGARSLGAVLIAASFVLPQQDMRPMSGVYWLRGCKGLQPSKVGEDQWNFDQDLEGARSLGADAD